MTDLHPDVAEYRQTCAACPEQYEGRLTDGRWFYFRVRWGKARLAIGDTLDEVLGREHVITTFGDPMQGQFEEEGQREAVFAELLADWRYERGIR